MIFLFNKDLLCSCVGFILTITASIVKELK